MCSLPYDFQFGCLEPSVCRDSLACLRLNRNCVRTQCSHQANCVAAARNPFERLKPSLLFEPFLFLKSIKISFELFLVEIHLKPIWFPFEIHSESTWNPFGNPKSRKPHCQVYALGFVYFFSSPKSTALAKRSLEAVCFGFCKTRSTKQIKQPP